MNIDTNNMTTYIGGNNGGTFAEYLHDEGILKDGLSIDDWYDVATKIPYLYPNFPKWIKPDDFWEDFAYRVEELGYSIAC